MLFVHILLGGYGMGKFENAPFPYFGGKGRVVEEVWGYFGLDVVNYVEPFFGSGAMLLGSPKPKTRRLEVVNDLNCFVANFWRAVRVEPDAVARWASDAVVEVDIHARHGWLLNRGVELRKLLENPDAYDVKIAGWWLYGMCVTIGGVWCSGRGTWMLDESLGEIVKGVKGVGGFDKAIFASKGMGIFSFFGDGDRLNFVTNWMRVLQSRLRDVKVACGDWSRVLSRSFLEFNGLSAVFLDPPYAKGDYVYGGGVDRGVHHEVREWCALNGGNPSLRIVLCGHDTDHDALLELGWGKANWKAVRGYSKNLDLYKREAIWYSPHCVISGDLF